MLEKQSQPSSKFLMKCALLYFYNRVVIPNINKIRKTILNEAHQAPYFAHLSSANIRENLKSISFSKEIRGISYIMT